MAEQRGAAVSCEVAVEVEEAGRVPAESRTRSVLGPAFGMLGWLLCITLLVVGGSHVAVNTFYAYPTALSCDFDAPVVPLPEMHLEIRQLLLEQYFAAHEGAILMNGADVTYRYDTDVEQGFRQESNFLYMSGYDQPNATMVIDVATRKTVLFVPFRPKDYAIWNGVIESLDEIRQEYMVDEVYYHEDLPTVLAGFAANDPNYVVYVMNDKVRFEGADDYALNTAYLQKAVYSRRELKTDFEMDLMRYAANVSANAHVLVMNTTRPGEYEYNVEGKFLDGCFACGLTVQAYLPICASGNSSAILHYNANDQLLVPGDLLLIDAGGEYHGYATDITRTYPTNGVFSPTQALVYEMVLRIQTRTTASLYAGMPWKDIQANCVQYTCEELYNQGFISADTATCVSERVYYIFFPHGVSHYLGLDVHDRSGDGSGTLEARNVITVEPGIYFNAALIEPAFEDPLLAPYLVKSAIQPLLDEQFGGVRIEDAVIVHENGVEVISSWAPKLISAIEKLMAPANSH